MVDGGWWMEDGGWWMGCLRGGGVTLSDGCERGGVENKRIRYTGIQGVGDREAQRDRVR